jgi:hypothetical protein
MSRQKPGKKLSPRMVPGNVNRRGLPPIMVRSGRLGNRATGASEGTRPGDCEPEMEALRSCLPMLDTRLKSELFDSEGRMAEPAEPVSDRLREVPISGTVNLNADGDCGLKGVVVAAGRGSWGTDDEARTVGGGAFGGVMAAKDPGDAGAGASARGVVIGMIKERTCDTRSGGRFSEHQSASPISRRSATVRIISSRNLLLACSTSWSGRPSCSDTSVMT